MDEQILRAVQIRTFGMSAAALVRELLTMALQEIEAVVPNEPPEVRLALAQTILEDVAKEFD